MNIILIIVFFAIVLVSDFKKTKGFVKAKVLHFLVLTYLFYNHMAAFKWLAEIVISSETRCNLQKTVGLINGTINYIQNLVLVVVSIIIVISAFGMLNRNDYYRKILLRAILFVIPSEIINYYVSYVSSPKVNLIIDDYAPLIIGFVISISINLFIFFLYRSRLMLDFFHAKHIK